jgi:hypothetical protein
MFSRSHEIGIDFASTISTGAGAALLEQKRGSEPGGGGMFFGRFDDRYALGGTQEEKGFRRPERLGGGRSRSEQPDPIEPLAGFTHDQVAVMLFDHGQGGSGDAGDIEGRHSVHQGLRNEAVPKRIEASLRREFGLRGCGTHELVPIRVRPGLAII